MSIRIHFRIQVDVNEQQRSETTFGRAHVLFTHFLHFLLLIKLISSNCFECLKKPKNVLKPFLFALAFKTSNVVPLTGKAMRIHWGSVRNVIF